MAGESIIASGTFTQPATATAQILKLNFKPDWLKVWNMTALQNAVNNAGTTYDWSAWMIGFNGVYDQAIVTLYNAASTAVVQALSAGAAPGVQYINTSTAQNGAPIAVTRIDNAAHPLVYTGNTANLVSSAAGVPGSIVRLIDPANNAGTRQFMGLDFSVGTIVANTTFQLAYAPQVVNAVSATQYVQIPTFGSFYPRTRYIAAITRAAQAVVTFTVQHGYQVGQTLRFGIVPVQYGMTQISGLTGTVLAVNLTNNTVTVNINTTAFTAFAFPLDAVAAAMNYQWPQVAPFGEDTATALSLGAQILGDSTVDQGFTGFILGNGIVSPGGQANDVSIWVAGTSQPMAAGGNLGLNNFPAAF